MKFLFTKFIFIILLFFTIDFTNARHLKKRLKRFAIPLTNLTESTTQSNAVQLLNNSNGINKTNNIDKSINYNDDNEKFFENNTDITEPKINVIPITENVLINHFENKFEIHNMENNDSNIQTNINTNLGNDDVKLVKEINTVAAGSENEASDKEKIIVETTTTLAIIDNPNNNSNSRWKKDVERLVTNANNESKDDAEDNLNIFKYNGNDVYDEKDNAFPLDVTLNINDGVVLSSSGNNIDASHSDNTIVNGDGHTLKSHRYYRNADTQQEQQQVITQTPTSSLMPQGGGLPFPFYSQSDLIMPLNARHPFSPLRRHSSPFYNPLTLFDFYSAPMRHQNIFEQSGGRDMWSNDYHYPTPSPLQVPLYDDIFGNHYEPPQAVKSRKRSSELQNAFEFANILFKIGLDENVYDSNNNNKKLNKQISNENHNKNNNTSAEPNEEQHNGNLCPFSIWSSFFKQQQPKQRQSNVFNNNNENIEEIDDIFIIIEPIEKSEIKTDLTEQPKTKSPTTSYGECTCRNIMDHNEQQHTLNIENNNNDNKKLELSSDIIDDFNLIASMFNNNNNDNKNYDDYKPQHAITSRLPILKQQINNNTIKSLNGDQVVEQHGQVLVNEEDELEQHEHVEDNNKNRIKKEIIDVSKISKQDFDNVPSTGRPDTGSIAPTISSTISLVKSSNDVIFNDSPVRNFCVKKFPLINTNIDNNNDATLTSEKEALAIEINSRKDNTKEDVIEVTDTTTTTTTTTSNINKK